MISSDPKSTHLLLHVGTFRYLLIVSATRVPRHAGKFLSVPDIESQSTSRAVHREEFERGSIPVDQVYQEDFISQ